MRRLLLLLTLAATPLFSHAIEEPDYEVIRKFDNVELRRYTPYIVAEVVLDAPAKDAGSQAFPAWPATSSARTRARRSSR